MGEILPCCHRDSDTEANYETTASTQGRWRDRSAIAAGGIGLSLTAGPVAAASFNISGTDISVDDGDVSYLDLSVDDHWAIWDGFDRPVAAVAFRDVIRNPDTGVSHELFDQRGDDRQPVLLSEFSGKGDSSGWGGGGEYASEDPDTYVQATGPTTAGFVHADVNWRLLDDEGANAQSIEDPGDTDDFDLDNLTDDTTETTKLELVKQVWLYSNEQTGRGSISTQNGTTVYLMGNDDGTREKIEVVEAFNVDVRNEASTTTVDGSGSTSGG